MTTLGILTRRNMKLFFKDKGLFWVSLITPLILLVLYATFLFKVFEDAFASSIPEFLTVDKELIDAFVSGQLTSSLLAVSCVTVAFCSNAVMVADKYSDTIKDFLVTPVRKSTLAFSYYLATMFSTLIIAYVGMGICFGYMASFGWYLTFTDVLWISLDVFLLVNFGVALSSVIHFFLKTQGHMSAVGTVVSACYGFICGAYMPMSNFPEGLQNVLSFLPGTYATVLLRGHCMTSILHEFHFPKEVNESILQSMDAKISFFETEVTVPAMYGILAGAVVILLAVYILENALRKRVAK